MSSINSGIWDTHVHVLNPVQFPFKSSRTYTPELASLDQLISSSPATNFLVVQASVEDGPDAILHHLDLRDEHTQIGSSGLRLRSATTMMILTVTMTRN
ncbi:hypothetical protein ASPSYDRAFT_46414 [Aspergillus sydowii CBS 593.65]|uniref:Amidohydrolase-related domain-containing protein n=1 Tax=Aspergillus sydowii CBS 593.65 TaxID=1036612 RepID=A0A1L9TG38_9EURO|nr:uncharacterized protein ASPSYDRAFT_46414 [Aspergillus sydowii CBS 593.65]OJJ58396.1 hypothetical protein ASPSYDRAFT_46414 [Aspergillus sydowii CBS 593.65]